MIIKKHTEFTINNKLYYSEEDIDTCLPSVLVVDWVRKTTYENVNAIPVRPLVCDVLENAYVIKNNFLIVGGTEDICLI